MEPRCPIPGSETAHNSGGSWLAVGDDDLTVSPTIVIRRPQRVGDLGKELLSGSLPRMSRTQAEEMLRVDPGDLALVHSFVRGYGLKVIGEIAEARTVQVEGSVLRVGQAFGVDIQWRIDPEGRKYLSYQGPLTLPCSLAGVVEAVLGLDQRPVARRGAGGSS